MRSKATMHCFDMLGLHGQEMHILWVQSFRYAAGGRGEGVAPDVLYTVRDPPQLYVRNLGWVGGGGGGGGWVPAADPRGDQSAGGRVLLGTNDRSTIV